MTKHGLHALDLLGHPPGYAAPLRFWDAGVAWRDLNPEKGVFSFEKLDQMVGRLGSKPLMVLGGTPQWAAKFPYAVNAAPWVGPASNSVPKDMADWNAFVQAISKRYAGRLDYQIWNEPQLSEFLSPWIDVTMIANMTRHAFDIIKKNDPKALVVAAPVLPRPTSGGMRRGGTYLSQLKRVGWPVDVFDFHAYPEIGRGPLRFRWMIQEVQKELATLKAPKKPLWCTEINYNLMGGPIAKWKVAPYMQATDKFAKSGGVDRVYWYAQGHGNPEIFGIPFLIDSPGTKTLRGLVR